MVNNDFFLKLKDFRIPGKVLDQISALVKGRKQSVQIPFIDNNGCFCTEESEEIALAAGDPHGTVFGPITFILFTNNISRQISPANFIQFADDDTQTLAGDSQENL